MQFNPSAHCFVGRKCREDYFHMQRSPYPGEELQTKHSFILPLPFTPSTETMLDESSQQKKKTLTFSTNYWKQCRGGRRQNFKILKTMVSGKMYWAPSVRERWANFRVTSANTNNCSGSLSLSALEVWLESFNALQPISLPLIFPLVWFVFSQEPPSVSHSSAVRVSKLFICTQT